VEQNDAIDSLKKEKEDIKLKYKKQVRHFCYALAFIDFLLTAVFYSKIGLNSTIVMNFFLTILLPLLVYIILRELIQKEKALKFVNAFIASRMYVFILLSSITLCLSYIFKDSSIDDLNAIISLYSISWAIFGVSISVLGIWLSINYTSFFKKENTFSNDALKYHSAVGLIFVVASLIIDLLFLFEGVGFFSNGTAQQKSSIFIAMIYASANCLMNIITFLMIPFALEIIYRSKNLNYGEIEAINLEIKLTESEIELEQIKKTLDEITTRIRKNGKRISKLDKKQKNEQKSNKQNT